MTITLKRGATLLAVGLIAATSGFAQASTHPPRSPVAKTWLAGTERAARPSAESDRLQTGGSKVKQPKVAVLHVDVTPDLVGLEPCIKVRRSLYKRGTEKDKIAIAISITYTSKGKTIVKNVTVPFDTFTFATMHPRDDKKFVYLVTTVNVSAAPVDRNTTASATATVVKVGGGHAP